MATVDEAGIPRLQSWEVQLPSLKVARRVGELVVQGMPVEEALSLISEEQEA